MMTNYETFDLYKAARLKAELPELYTGIAGSVIPGSRKRYVFSDEERILAQMNTWRSDDVISRYISALYDCKRDLREATQ